MKSCQPQSRLSVRKSTLYTSAPSGHAGRLALAFPSQREPSVFLSTDLISTILTRLLPRLIQSQIQEAGARVSEVFSSGLFLGCPPLTPLPLVFKWSSPGQRKGSGRGKGKSSTMTSLT